MTQLAVIPPEIEQALVPRFEQLGIDEKKVRMELSFAAQHIENNSYLQKCPANTTINAILNAVQCGLTLSPLAKECYLVPRQGKCELDPSYIGLAKTITDTGAVTHFVCQVIYENDDYIVDLASEKIVNRHTPAVLLRKEKGSPIACYSIAHFPDGKRHVEFVNIEGKDGIYETSRRRSESWKYYESQKAQGRTVSCPWVTDEEQMIRKATIKRHVSKLPRTVGDWSLVDKIVDTDNKDYSLEAGQQEIGAINRLLQAIEMLVDAYSKPVDTEEYANQIEERMANGLTIDQAEDIKQELTKFIASHYKAQLAETGHEIGDVVERGESVIVIKGVNMWGKIRGVYLNDDGEETKKRAALYFSDLLGEDEPEETN